MKTSKRLSFAILIVAVLLVIAGCLTHPQAQTFFVIAAPGQEVPYLEVQREIIRIVDATANSNGFQLVDDRLDSLGRTSYKNYLCFDASKQRGLYLSLHSQSSQFTVQIHERYVSQPTRKHLIIEKELSTMLVEARIPAIKSRGR